MTTGVCISWLIFINWEKTWRQVVEISQLFDKNLHFTYSILLIPKAYNVFNKTRSPGESIHFIWGWGFKNKRRRSKAKSKSQWPLCVITSPSLVCKQNSSHLHYLWVGILFNWIALRIHLCKTLQLYILKTRLGGEIYSSDVNIHKGYQKRKKILTLYQTHVWMNSPRKLNFNGLKTNNVWQHNSHLISFNLNLTFHALFLGDVFLHMKHLSSVKVWFTLRTFKLYRPYQCLTQ